MKRLSKILFAAAIVAVVGGGILAAPKVRTSKRVTINCEHGWRGSAVGSYGGVLFGVSCQNGNGNTTLPATNGTAYSFRVGVESDAIAADCVFTVTLPDTPAMLVAPDSDVETTVVPGGTRTR